jgi:hypothetical protein
MTRIDIMILMMERAVDQMLERMTERQGEAHRR